MAWSSNHARGRFWRKSQQLLERCPFLIRLCNGHILMNQVNYLRSHDRFQLTTWSSTFRTLLKRRLRMKGAKYAHVTSPRIGWLLKQMGRSFIKKEFHDGYNETVCNLWYSMNLLLKELLFRNACNRPFALRGHVTNASLKQWVIILLLPKLVRTHKNCLTSDIWEETHLRKIFYGTLIFR